ncbi:DUF2268 domain-containing protein [Psychrobacillus sp. NPDC096426]|uniref:DUF2268 domain-containing protein n=1 Tax=Psychrobacillus sp. NPDC096426 TaxID=3364491 RepID=UPI003808F945
MPVIQTQNMLYKFVELCEEQSGKGATSRHSEIICEPLMKLFPTVNQDVVQYELLRNGLFKPEEWRNIKDTVKRMEAQNVWQIVKQEYKLLRKRWNGPKVSIYIFPIENANGNSRKDIPKKNGIAYRGTLFLFLSPDLHTEEIKALFAHEYNHVCRLDYLNLAPSMISLKDSLIIEGLGEYAVKDLYGEKWLAPWISFYAFEEALAVWRKHFLPSLNITGVKHHQVYLFGKAGSRLPKWIGYHIGFQIVDSFQKKHGPFPNNELYKKSSEEIIAGSDFPININDI